MKEKSTQNKWVTAGYAIATGLMIAQVIWLILGKTEDSFGWFWSLGLLTYAAAELYKNSLEKKELENYNGKQ